MYMFGQIVGFFYDNDAGGAVQMGGFGLERLIMHSSSHGVAKNSRILCGWMEAGIGLRGVNPGCRKIDDKAAAKSEFGGFQSKTTKFQLKGEY
jgi:hypothetical protein